MTNALLGLFFGALPQKIAEAGLRCSNERPDDIIAAIHIKAIKLRLSKQEEEKKEVKKKKEEEVKRSQNERGSNDN